MSGFHLLCRPLTIHSIFSRTISGTEYWEGVLSVSTRFIDDESRASALQQLAHGDGQCRPAQMVYLARKYDVPEWLDHSFRSLINTDPSEITPTDILHLSSGAAFTTTYLLISQARSAILKRRRSILMYASTPSHGPACYTRPTCEASWSTQYRLYMTMYNHPENLIPATEIIDRMERAETPAAMGPCWRRSVETLKVGRFVTGEPELIDTFVNQLVGLSG